MKMLLYCTKTKWQLFRDIITGKWLIDKIKNRNAVNGKIVVECDYEVEKIKNKLTNDNSHLELSTVKLTEKELFEKSCLNRYEMFNYLQNNFTKKGESNGYAIHIKNLHIYDEPKELSDFYKDNETFKYIKELWENYGLPDKDDYDDVIIKKAPQNMMYAYDKDSPNEYALISIRPEWLCKILNGEKTVEVRKKVLREMLK